MQDRRQMPLLVTGAGGQLGRRVVELLLDQGASRVIATSRRPTALSDLAARGVEVRPADFDDPAGLDRAFAGAARLLLVSTDAIGVPGQRLRQHLAAVAAARRAGVGHIAYTSMPNPEPGSPIPFAADHHGTEQAIIASGLDHTILRNAWYMENLFAALPQVLAGGTWYSAAGTGRVGHVAREDAARAAAAALLSAEVSGRVDVTGPQALSTADVAAIAGRVFGRAIQVVPVDEAQLAAGMEAAGIPAPMIPLLVAFDTNTRAGRVDIVSDAVARLTGAPPQALEAFLAANRAAVVSAA